MRIAIDFDGTIVENNYPSIGKEKLFAFETLKELQKQGNHLILWTFRTGRELQEAIDFCKEKGLDFYAVNKNYPEEVLDEHVPRKLDADLFIDDRNFGGFPGWQEIWKALNQFPQDPDVLVVRSALKRKGLFHRIGSLLSRRENVSK
jgi:hypothetical protein